MEQQDVRDQETCVYAKEPKELYSGPDAEHNDLYDRVDMIPFNKLESLFTENM